MIPKEIVEEIIDRNDIEEVIGSYVSLKRAGSRKSGLCPFHSEKTPSFTVFPDTRSFYCFGCGAGGDVVSFIRKIENLDYVDALEFLARRAGVTIPKDDGGVRAKKSVSRNRVYEMNLEAARFFRNCLFDPQIGREGMRYLAEVRKLSSAVIRRFGLGFAPNTFNMLTDYMRSKGFSEEELIAAFLCGRSPKTGRLFDLFRNRVIFPVIDTTGRVVAFGGRVMDDGKPKYLNSSDTPVFKKSQVLFGLNYAKDHCAEQIILCEGYMDAIAMHAAGFENAVATLGTAITSDHARLLTRYKTGRVIINYDSDEAGQKAADKAMRLLDEVGLDVKVLKLEGAKDADEYIRTCGADAFRQLLEGSRTAFDFKMSNILSRYDPSTPDGKIHAARELAAIIAPTASGVERELYISAAAAKLGISAESLAGDGARLRAQRRKEAARKESRDIQVSVRNFGDKVNPDAAKNPAAAAAENTALGLLLLYPEHRRAVLDGKVPLPEEHFFTAFGKKVYHVILELEQSEAGFSFSALGEYLTPDEMGRLVRLQQERQELTNNSTEVLVAAAEVLAKEYRKRSERESGDWTSELMRRREARQNNTKK